MGRYISTGTTQVNACIQYTNATCYQVNCHKYSYCANECWQNKVLLDSPGSYTFTVPNVTGGTVCLRTVAVGGGGKSYINCGACCGTAGGGGGYSEKVDQVKSGCTVTVVVGRQQGDTTIAYTNTVGSAVILTGGGAAGAAPGAATGGDWNSIGGNGGINCNYCGGLSHYCGSCIYTTAFTCCGYCIVVSGVSARQIDPNHGDNDCCTSRYSGGASAGSWIWNCGGMGQCAANAVPVFSLGYGISVGGGGGIGYIRRTEIRSAWCTCICHKSGYNGTFYNQMMRNMCCLSATGGGGGTKFQCCNYCDCQNFIGICQQGRYRNGHGGWGGFDNNEGRGQEHYWWRSEGGNFQGPGQWGVDIQPGPSPKQYPWHDIHSMCGSGSAGRGFWSICTPNNSFVSGIWDTYPDNAGEGAGTGGVGYFCCDMTFFVPNCCINGVDAYAMLNFSLICCLGTSNRVCCADKMMPAIAPYIIACAGTLGGAGGFAFCNGAQKAGKGGGQGVNRSYIVCVCYGGAYDCCNQVASTPLAFPPSELDWRVSPAGTGMALIYWKDA